MHGSVLGFFAYGALQTREVRGKRVLEVGALDVNGSIRTMVEARQPASYLGIDILPGPGVDRVLDVKDLTRTFGRDSFDVVICCETLEHVGDWRAAIRNLVEVLTPGGVLVITTRSLGYPWHHPPDTWRYSQAAFAQILDRLALEPVVLMDDPECAGVFVKARKPGDWCAPCNTGRALWHIGGITPVPTPTKILGIPYAPDGTAFYRFTLPWNRLVWHGHTAELGGYGKADEQTAIESDVIVQQRPALPEQVAAWRRWAKHGGPRLVYETDDLIFDPDPSALANWLDRDLRQGALACLIMADLVTVSTPYLAEQVRPHNSSVVVLPDCIDAALLRMERPQRDEVTVLWAGGASHKQDLMLLHDPMRELDGEPFELHVIGEDYRPLLAGHGARGRYTPWVSDVPTYYTNLDGDLAVIPLVDTKFNRARAHIKALEMAALGIPVIASDLEPYRELVIDGVTGYLVRTPQEWTSRIRELVNDPAARTEMGAKAREVAAGWTIQQHWRQWAAAYTQTAATGGQQ